jgi:hypothetical protein
LRVALILHAFDDDRAAEIVGGHEDVATTLRMRCGAGFDQLVAYALHAPAAIRKQQGKGIAAGAEHVGRARKLHTEPLGGFHEHAVAAAVAKARVNRFEPVDVE